MADPDLGHFMNDWSEFEQLHRSDRGLVHIGSRDTCISNDCPPEGLIIMGSMSRGNPSSDRKVGDLPPPPSGAAPGAFGAAGRSRRGRHDGCDIEHPHTHSAVDPEPPGFHAQKAAGESFSHANGCNVEHERAGDCKHEHGLTCGHPEPEVGSQAWEQMVVDNAKQMFAPSAVAGVNFRHPCNCSCQPTHERGSAMCSFQEFDSMSLYVCPIEGLYLTIVCGEAGCLKALAVNSQVMHYIKRQGLLSSPDPLNRNNQPHAKLDSLQWVAATDGWWFDTENLLGPGAMIRVRCPEHKPKDAQ